MSGMVQSEVCAEPVIGRGAIYHRKVSFDKGIKRDTAQFEVAVI